MKNIKTAVVRAPATARKWEAARRDGFLSPLRLWRATTACIILREKRLVIEPGGESE